MTLRRLLLHCLALPLLVAPASLGAQMITVTFDVPDSFGTFPQSINKNGDVAGYYRDGDLHNHGFFRQANNVLTTFDVPGSLSTTPLAVNAHAQIVGSYEDAAGVHGFLRNPDGTFTVFDGSGSDATYPRALSAGGLITGYYFDPIGVRGFLREKTGKMIAFDAPGNFSITFPQSINRMGQITGWNIDQPGASGRGFVRERDGTFTRTFDSETYAVAINANGEVAGYIGNGTTRGFLSQPDGSEILFDVVSSPISANPVAIDHAGRTAGWYYDPNSGFALGFLRKRDGTFITFMASPSAGDTFPTSMYGQRITGYYSDENGQHGFIRDSINTSLDASFEAVTSESVRSK